MAAQGGAVLEHGADQDAAVETAIPIPPKQGAAVGPPRHRLQFGDALAGPQLGCPGDGAPRPAGLQQVHPAGARPQLAGDHRGEVVDLGVALQAHQLWHLDRAALADAAEVVAQEIDDHHVLGAVLAAADQLRRLIGVLLGIDHPRPRAFNRTRLDSAAWADLQEAFRRGRDHRLPGGDHEAGKGGRAAPPQTLKQGQGFSGGLQCAGAAGREVRLKDVAAGDAFTDPLDPRAEVFRAAVPVPVGNGRWLRGAGLGSRQCCRPGGHGLQASGVEPLQPERLLLQVEAKDRIVAGDPEGRHRVGLPVGRRFHPGGGFVAEPAAPMPLPELAQRREGIATAALLREAAADDLLERIGGQAGPAPQAAAVPIEPDQPLRAEARGEVAGEVSGFDPGERPLARPWSAAHCSGARQVGTPGLDQGRIANAAAVADAARVLAAAVATPGLLNGHPQAQRLLDDLGFAPLHQGRPELGAMALSAGLAGQVRQGLEGTEVIRAAVRVAGVIDRIDPEHQPFGAAGLRQAEADADEHRVAPRDIGAGDHPVLHPRVGNLHGGVRQGGATPGRQVDADAVVFGQAQGLRDRGGGLEFAPMALAVVKGEADDAVALRLGEGGGGGGIQPSGEQGDGG